MARKGETWNESEVYDDAMTLRLVRRITTGGLYNQTPTYHTGIAFSADGEFLVFGTAREGKSAVMRCHVPTGDLTQLTDPVEGSGNYGELNKGGFAPGNGLGITGKMCIAPDSLWVAYMAGRALCAVHADTLEERTLIADIGAEWLPGVPSIDPQEEHVILPAMSAHPDVVAGRRISVPYMEHFAKGGMQLRILQVGLDGGEVTTVYSEDGVGGAHTPHCPADGDLLLVDRDFAPRFWAGSDGRTNRIWTLRLSTGTLAELPPQDEARFQVHSCWTWDGRNVIYHGPSARGGWYVGVVDREGRTVREYCFYRAGEYGHVSAMAGRPAVILDGNLSDDLLLWLYYDGERPRVEVIARHGTDWGAMAGQYPHPHPHSDPTGRWISFNAAHRGRSDVFVVRV
jgi:hypothetical protein